jgi:DNA-binding transcriptional LysR family regulator
MNPYIERPNLMSLRLFLAAVELGSIAEVGRRHFIAPTAVTKRMHELETELGVELLYRTSKGVSPTAAGVALARHARAMSGLAERMRTEMAQYAHGARGHLRLVANSSSLVEYVAEEISRFIQAYPGVEVDLREARSDEVVRAVRDGTADLGIYTPPVTNVADVEVYPYRSDRLLAVVPAGHVFADRTSIAFSELQQHPFIGVGTNTSLAALLAQETAGALGHTFRVNSAEVARWMVSKGLGVSILPEGQIVPYEAALDVRAIALTDSWAHRQLLLCVRDSKTLPAAPRAMFEALTP